MDPSTFQLFLCRHGQTEWSAAGRHTGRTDLPLTEKGREQARALKGTFSKLPIDHVICSPLQRARETCALAGFSHPIVQPLAVEWDYGDYEGLTHAQIRETNPHWNLLREGVPNGESPQEIAHRADLFLQSLQTLPGKVLLFSHGHFLKVLTTRWLGLNIEHAACFVLGVASLSTLAFERQTRAVTLWNQVS